MSVSTRLKISDTLPLSNGTTSQPILQDSLPALPFWRLSVDQYHEMIRTGILTNDDQVELLEGWLIAKMPKNPAHHVATYLIRKALESLVPTGWYVESQEPITTANSEPEPDIMVVRGDIRDYLERHPGPEDITLIVEVSDATLRRDKSFKKRLYAQAGIPVYWVINLPQSQCEVYSQPILDQSDYQHHQVYHLSDTIPVIIEGEVIGELSARDILP